MFNFLMICITIPLFLWSNIASSDTQTITLKKPPEALAQWYKPENKRQVWLHTMFRLRREMLAMNDYSQQKMQPELEKWSQKFIKDYQSIADMVPQWQEYLYTDKVKELEQQVKAHNYAAINPLLKQLGKSCMHCHDDFQTVTTLLMRSPNFSNKTISDGIAGEETAYDDNMQQLSESVNRINIAIKDAYFSIAEKNIEGLQQQLDHLGNSCRDCHKEDKIPVERIMGAADTLLPELTQNLQLKEQQQSARKLGEFAVKVCAKCHSIHKLPSDLQLLFN